MKKHENYTEYENGDTITLELTYGKPEKMTIVTATSPTFNETLGEWEQTLDFGPGTQPACV